MTEIIVAWLQNFIHTEYLLLYVLSIIPVTELRGALVLSGGMSVNPWLAYLACVAGACTVVLPLLLIFAPLMRWLKRTRLFKPVAEMIENMLKDKGKSLAEQNKKKGNTVYWALYVFVAIPLPLTGAWTGAAIAAFLGLKYWKSALAITMGNLTAGMVLTILMLVAKDYVDIILIVFICIFALGSLIVFAKKWQKNHRQKSEIDKAEAEVPEDETPFIGEFAAGGEDEQELIVEVVDEDDLKDLIPEEEAEEQTENDVAPTDNGEEKAAPKAEEIKEKKPAAKKQKTAKAAAPKVTKTKQTAEKPAADKPITETPEEVIAVPEIPTAEKTEEKEVEKPKEVKPKAAKPAAKKATATKPVTAKPATATPKKPAAKPSEKKQPAMPAQKPATKKAATPAKHNVTTKPRALNEGKTTETKN